MHGEIRQPTPGFCPLCGMDLVQISGASEVVGSERSSENPLEKSQEQLALLKKIKLGLALMLPLLALHLITMTAMSAKFFLNALFSEKLILLLQLAFSIPIIFWGGSSFFKKAFLSLKGGSLNMFSLISLGVLSAFFFSLVVTIALLSQTPERFHMIWGPWACDHYGHLNVYFEAAAAIVILTLIGQYIESSANEKAYATLTSLSQLIPRTACKINPDGSEVEVKIQDIAIGDLIRVRAGEQIPVDGKIESGLTAVNQSLLTGESIPITKGLGDVLRAGTINGEGIITLRAISPSKESYVTLVGKFVQHALSSRIPTQDLVDQIASVFIPLVLLIAIGTLIYWTSTHQYANAITKAIAVLIIACPCALGLATPLAVLVASTRAARCGILIRDVRSLQKLAKVTLIAIDKTGTLTSNLLSLKSIVIPTGAGGMAEKEVLGLAASLAKGSSHPLSRLIVESAEEAKAVLPRVEEIKEKSGEGMVGTIGNTTIFLGNYKFLTNHNIAINTTITDQTESQTAFETITYLAIDGELVAAIIGQEKLKETSLEALHDIQQLGIKVIILSGDNAMRTQRVAESLNLPNFFAQLLPTDKAQVIQDYRSKGYVVAMAGDGINDAPALAVADIGIAMASGSSLALETADLILVDSDLKGILRAIRLSKSLLNNIHQNLILAFGYNVLAIPIAAGLLQPSLGIELNPVLASIAMAGSSLSVILNSLRLRNIKL